MTCKCGGGEGGGGERKWFQDPFMSFWDSKSTCVLSMPLVMHASLAVPVYLLQGHYCTIR